MTIEPTAAIITILTIGIALIAFVVVRARKAIRAVTNSLRIELRNQRNEIARQAKVLAKQRTEVARHARVLNEQSEVLGETTTRTLRIEERIRTATVERMLPPRPPNSTRSVLFFDNGGCSFENLAAALRRRGWDAVLVSNHPLGNRKDGSVNDLRISLIYDNPSEFQLLHRGLFDLVPDRFRMIHFGGSTQWDTNFFRQQVDRSSNARTETKWNFNLLKEQGVKIGYTVSGCMDGVRQSVYKSHKNVCVRCPWEKRPELCSDKHNSSWGRTIAAMCDLVAVEQEFGHEWRTEPFAYREPLTTALDPDYWHTKLEIPTPWRIRRADTELVVMQTVTNPAIERFGGCDISGTGAIIAAINRLQSEGFNVRLEQLSSIPSYAARYLMAQADVVVDQLAMGRYGAQARKAMMLGKPTICHIDRREPNGIAELSCWTTCPLVDATEATIYPVLKYLLSSASERIRIGHASRAYAMKWHAADKRRKEIRRNI